MPSVPATQLAIVIYYPRIDDALEIFNRPETRRAIKEQFPDVSDDTWALLPEILRYDTRAPEYVADALDQFFSEPELTEIVSFVEASDAVAQYVQALTEGRFDDAEILPNTETFQATATGQKLLTVCTDGTLVQAVTNAGFAAGVQSGMERRKSGQIAQPD